MSTESLSLCPLNRPGGENKKKESVGQDNDRDVTHHHHGQKRHFLGKINLLTTKLSWMMRKKDKTNMTFPPHILLSRLILLLRS